MRPSTDERVIVWQPSAGPQKALIDCPYPEIFYGGARGGGKTDGVLGKWALKAKRYGRHFNAKGFRRTGISFEDAIERAKEIYLPLGAKFVGAPYPLFRMPWGGRIRFGYLESLKDAENEQGKNLTDAWVEEAGQYPDPGPIDRLFGVLRSASGVPTQMILTANPGGAGQGWIRKRYGLVPFPAGPKIVTRTLANGSEHRMAVIPSRLTDNPALMMGDPGYLDRLHLVGSAQLVSAWVEGDWNQVEGAFFSEWDEKRHVIVPTALPSQWLRFRSMDWGSASPFSVGWWAVVEDEFDATSLSGSTIKIPRGAIVRYREWYGCQPERPNVGLKLTAEQIADGIAERELGETVDHGVVDPSMFKQDGGPSIAERMRDREVYFRPGDNTRIGRNGASGGWDMMRARLRGEDGRPMLYVFSTCRDFIRTVPVLQHDQSRAEDLDTDAEDHVADEVRYACMSRPWVPTRAVAVEERRGGYSSNERRPDRVNPLFS